MKLCIPVVSAEGLSAPLHADFGAARHLLIVDGEAVHAVDREHPELISEEVVSGIQGILCSEIHPRLLFELQHNGIHVYGCEAASAGEALAMFQAGELEAAPPFNPGEEPSGGCCGGHAHGEAGGDHECCGGKGHDDPDHECCGGKGHDNPEHECCGGKGHDQGHAHGGGRGGCGCGH
jgi:predicted Fe-Mo cluster-binding NifX family protein